MIFRRFDRNNFLVTNNSCWHVTKNGLLKIIGIRIIKLKVNVFWSSVPVTATTKEIIGYKNSKYILTKQTAAIIQNVFWPNLIYLGHKYKMGHRYYCSRVLDETDHQDFAEQGGNHIGNVYVQNIHFVFEPPLPPRPIWCVH